MERMGTILPGLGKLQIAGGIAAIVGIALLAVAFPADPVAASQSYLLGFVIWTSVTLGCLSLTILAHLVRGAWAVPFLRFFESGALLSALMALLFVPLIFMIPHLYPWADPEVLAHDAIVQHKAQYMFAARWIAFGFIYFILWFAFAFFLNKYSDEQDRTGDKSLVVRRTNLAAPFAVFFVLTVSFSYTDWVMSLEPHWFSMIYGALMTVSQALTAISLGIVFLVLVRNIEPFKRLLTERQYRDMGNLLFTLVILWAYMSFSQFLIIWSGNLTEEITYFVARRQGLWEFVGPMLVFLHFLLPFFILLSSHVKRSPKLLGMVAGFILVMRVVDLFWNIVPSFQRGASPVFLSDIAAFLAIGGVWTVLFVMILKSRVPVPQYDPRLVEEVPEHA